MSRMWNQRQFRCGVTVRTERTATSRETDFPLRHGVKRLHVGRSNVFVL